MAQSSIIHVIAIYFYIYIIYITIYYIDFIDGDKKLIKKTTPIGSAKLPVKSKVKGFKQLKGFWLCQNLQIKMKSC